MTMGRRFPIASLAMVFWVSGSLLGCSGDDYEAPACPRRGGTAGVSALPSICPKIADYSVAPTEVLGAQPIALHATAEATDAGTLSFAWSATGGQIADSASPDTTFECKSPGAVTLTLTLSNGICGDSVTVMIDCLAD